MNDEVDSQSGRDQVGRSSRRPHVAGEQPRGDEREDARQDDEGQPAEDPRHEDGAPARADERDDAVDDERPRPQR